LGQTYTSNLQDLEIRKNGFIQLADTNNGSFAETHIANVKSFAADLQEAVNEVWPKRTQSRYTGVYLLLLSWEGDNLGVGEEVNRLRRIFQNFYRFDVEEYLIPSHKPAQSTQARAMKFLEHDNSNNLLIVYYAGHAKPNQVNEPPVWAA
jgi:hypothetical protein